MGFLPGRKTQKSRIKKNKFIWQILKQVSKFNTWLDGNEKPKNTLAMEYLALHNLNKI